jgi:hypothetical protein
MMKKLLTLLLTVLMLSAGSFATHASQTKELEIENQVKIKYPASVKLKAKGCQNIKVSYEIGILEDWDFAYVALVNEEDVHYAEKLVYKTPELAAEQGERVNKKKSSSTLKICRKPWTDDLGNGRTQDYLGIPKGTIKLILSTYTFGPKTSSITLR